MAIFEINKFYKENTDTEFHVDLLREMNGEDITHVVDDKAAFKDHDQLKQYLSTKLNIPIENIYILEI